MLIAARLVQGGAGALVSPAALSLLTTTNAEGAARNRALSIWQDTTAAGTTAGIVAGGLLTQYRATRASWPTGSAPWDTAGAFRIRGTDDPAFSSSRRPASGSSRSPGNPWTKSSTACCSRCCQPFRSRSPRPRCGRCAGPD
jgi:MFS family permease